VLDVKGEIYDLTSKWRRKNVGPVIKFNPRDPENSAHYNPLSFVRREALYVWADAFGAANMMLVPKETSGGKNEGYFQDTAVAVLTGIIADLAFWNRPEDRPMTKVLSILNRNGWPEFIDRLRKNPEVTAMRDLGSKLANEHPETLANVLSFAVSGLTAWMGEDITQVVSRSDWHPLDLRGGKRPTIYICINPQDIEDLASLLRVFIAQHINALMSQKVPPRGSEPILFVLDEFPRLGGMKPIEKALEVGRGYGLRLWLFAQNFGQIEHSYIDKVWKRIRRAFRTRRWWKDADPRGESTLDVRCRRRRDEDPSGDIDVPLGVHRKRLGAEFRIELIESLEQVDRLGQILSSGCRYQGNRP